MDAAACCGDPSCNQGRERKMVIVQNGADGRPEAWCDPCIATLVKALNDGGLLTVASCCGHGNRPGWVALKDGRQLVIARDLTECHRIEALFPADINGDTASDKSVSDIHAEWERLNLRDEYAVSAFIDRVMAELRRLGDANHRSPADPQAPTVVDDLVMALTACVEDLEYAVGVQGLDSRTWTPLVMARLAIKRAAGEGYE